MTECKNQEKKTYTHPDSSFLKDSATGMDVIKIRRPISPQKDFSHPDKYDVNNSFDTIVGKLHTST